MKLVLIFVLFSTATKGQQVSTNEEHLEKSIENLTSLVIAESAKQRHDKAEFENITNSIKSDLAGMRSELLQMQHSLTDQVQAVRNDTRSELLQMQQSLVEQIQAVRNDVCLINYTTINDADGVRSLENKARGYLCDSDITAGWYRWLLHGKDAIIPTSCTPTIRCGTLGTMWIDLNGQPLPSVGRDVQGRVCAHWGSDCCRWHVPSVSVRDCGSFYLYYLPTALHCSMAYCLQRQN